jgi:hypothetical protein
MKRRSSRKIEQPTWLAELNVVTESLPADDPIEDEQPTRLAALTIITRPLPPWDPAQPSKPEASV